MFFFEKIQKNEKHPSFSYWLPNLTFNTIKKLFLM
jgi:hypothetical protein